MPSRTLRRTPHPTRRLTQPPPQPPPPSQLRRRRRRPARSGSSSLGVPLDSRELAQGRSCCASPRAAGLLCCGSTAGMLSCGAVETRCWWTAQLDGMRSVGPCQDRPGRSTLTDVLLWLAAWTVCTSRTWSSTSATTRTALLRRCRLPARPSPTPPPPRPRTPSPASSRCTPVSGLCRARTITCALIPAALEHSREGTTSGQIILAQTCAGYSGAEASMHLLVPRRVCCESRYRADCHVRHRRAARQERMLHADLSEEG